MEQVWEQVCVCVKRFLEISQLLHFESLKRTKAPLCVLLSIMS